MNFTLSLPALLVVLLAGCSCAISPPQQKPASESTQDPPVTVEVVMEEHAYCACVAECEGREPALVPIPGIPEEQCQNPPPGCSGLPLYCHKSNLVSGPNDGVDPSGGESAPAPKGVREL